ncbi:hypothetical protein CCHR01_16327 [Colletotrichum chrysophilum]|uniref:Uncharacterized protein n=1 Tax=Colletotrichum chrysophilum TaxID=1836956 RepID=A0AAD9EDK1_9PEZI|nr:hypothetical protein CCHR01_16327 [Colletotrichum chrysophilum]
MSLLNEPQSSSKSSVQLSSVVNTSTTQESPLVFGFQKLYRRRRKQEAARYSRSTTLASD